MLLFFIKILFLTLLVNFILKKKNFAFDNKSYSSHKKLTSNKAQVPLSGGLIFIFLVFFSNLSIDYFFFIFVIFLLGFLSDLNILTSARVKILVQLAIVLLYIIFSSNYINSIRINFYDEIYNFLSFKMIFTLFCLLILINGSNFIDGINTLSLGYFLIVIVNLIFLSNKINIQIDNIQLVFSGLLVLYLFNLFEKLYLGDGGIYSLSFFIGIYLIIISNNNSIISPYYFALLLWYPAFENLFSILRRFFYRKSYFNPDNSHLHQILFLFLTFKFTIFIKFFLINIIIYLGFIQFFLKLFEFYFKFLLILDVIKV